MFLLFDQNSRLFEILLRILFEIGILFEILSDLNFSAGGGLWVCGSAGVGKEKFDLMTGGDKN